jgi:hypothetical protein
MKLNLCNTLRGADLEKQPPFHYFCLETRQIAVQPQWNAKEISKGDRYITWQMIVRRVQTYISVYLPFAMNSDYSTGDTFLTVPRQSWPRGHNRQYSSAPGTPMLQPQWDTNMYGGSTLSDTLDTVANTYNDMGSLSAFPSSANGGQLLP